MEAHDSLHETDTLTLYCVGNYNCGPANHLLRLFEGIKQLSMVVAINANDMPVKCAPLVSHRLEGDNFLSGAVNLQAIPIDDCSGKMENKAK